MKIIEAGIDDIERVSRLWLELVKELAPEYTPNPLWWIEIARNSFKAGVYHIFAAEKNGAIIGFIDFFIYPEPATGNIHGVGQHFYVLPEYRNTAVAGHLYRRAITTAREKGATVIELFCFPNELSFWKKKKFNQVRTLVRRTICSIQ